MNGNIRDAITYYESIGSSEVENYSGTAGSETNPWVIEDTYDFVASKNKISSGSLYLILVNDIDFNDNETYKVGFNNYPSNILYSASSCTIDGKNHTIRNLILNNSCLFVGGSSYLKILKNINFVNLILLNKGRIFSSASSSFSCYNCNFGIYLVNTHVEDFFGANFENCSLNFKGTTSLDNNSALSNSGGYKTLINTAHNSIKRCTINFSNLKLRKPPTWERIYILSSGNNQKMEFSNIIGTIQCINFTSDGIAIKKNSGTSVIQSYISIKFRQPDGTFIPDVFNSFGTSDSNDTNNFIDMGEGLEAYNSITPGTGWSCLTTTQAKDVDYLQNEVGFLVF